MKTRIVASVGIDHFIYLPQCNLSDCVLDAKHVQEAFKGDCDKALVLPDADASEKNHKDFLMSLKGGEVWPENTEILITESEHGTNIPGKEADGYDEGLVCNDYKGDGTANGLILDDWLNAFLHGVPASSRVYLWLDACMSMGMTKEFVWNRFIPNPACVGRRRKKRGLFAGLFSRDSVVAADESLHPNVAWFPGCAENGTSASTGSGGALTNSLLAARATLKGKGSFTNRQLMELAINKLKAGRFSQRPKLQCRAAMADEIFWKES